MRAGFEVPGEAFRVQRREGLEEVEVGDDVEDQIALELMADEFAIAAVANRWLSGRYDDRSDLPEFSAPPRSPFRIIHT